MEILDWADGNAEKLVQKYLDVEPNEVFSQKDLKNKGDYYIGTESSSDSETVFIDVCFGDEFEKHDNNIDKNYEYFTRFAEDISDNMNYDVSVMTNSDAQTILFQFTDWFPEESEEPEEDYADGGKVKQWKGNLYVKQTSVDYFGDNEGTSKSPTKRWFRINRSPMTKERLEEMAKPYIEKFGKQNVRTKNFEYMAEGGELDDEDSLDYNSISDLQSERNRLVRWSNQYGSKGADYKIKQLEKRIEYLKSKDSKMANGGELEDDTFVILFKAYGFVEKRGSYGTKTFYNRQHNAKIYYDPKYRSISGYVGGGEGNDEVIPYSVDGVLDFFIEHDITESEATPFKKGGTLTYGRGGMDVGRWYRDKSGEEFKYIGEDVKGQSLFNDGKKVMYKPLEDFEGVPEEKKLFKFFRMGGALKEDFLEDVAEMHDDIKEITLKDGSKITHDELMEAHQFLEPDETQEYYASMQYGKGGTFDSKVEAISKKLVGKPVPKQYRKEYGSRYDKQDADEAARRIVGNMRKLYGE